LIRVVSVLKQMLPTSHQIPLKQRNYITCLENAEVNELTVR